MKLKIINESKTEHAETGEEKYDKNYTKSFFCNFLISLLMDLNPNKYDANEEELKKKIQAGDYDDEIKQRVQAGKYDDAEEYLKKSIQAKYDNNGTIKRKIQDEDYDDQYLIQNIDADDLKKLKEFERIREMQEVQKIQKFDPWQTVRVFLSGLKEKNDHYRPYIEMFWDEIYQEIMSEFDFLQEELNRHLENVKKSGLTFDEYMKNNGDNIANNLTEQLDELYFYFWFSSDIVRKKEFKDKALWAVQVARKANTFYREAINDVSDYGWRFQLFQCKYNYESYTLTQFKNLTAAYTKGFEGSYSRGREGKELNQKMYINQDDTPHFIGYQAAMKLYNKQNQTKVANSDLNLYIIKSLCELIVYVYNGSSNYGDIINKNSKLNSENNYKKFIGSILYGSKDSVLKMYRNNININSSGMQNQLKQIIENNINNNNDDDGRIVYNDNSKLANTEIEKITLRVNNSNTKIDIRSCSEKIKEKIENEIGAKQPSNEALWYKSLWGLLIQLCASDEFKKYFGKQTVANIDITKADLGNNNNNNVNNRNNTNNGNNNVVGSHANNGGANNGNKKRYKSNKKKYKRR